MTNYYLKENDIITQSANWKFDDNCLETEEEIVRYEGQLMLASEYATLQNTSEYKLSKFQTDIQYQHDAYNEYAREIVYQIQYNTAVGNTDLVTSLQTQLQTEQQAVIERINAITEAYNNAQST